MRLITDWHVHSKYSRACSKDLELSKIADACRRKGIDVVATGDWTHPEWFSHMREQLREDAPGLYRLHDAPEGGTRFMLVTEVSQIYKKGDRTRRIHNLVFSPSLETCERVNAELDRRSFNRSSDGRPIFGMDSADFYKALKEIDERIIVVPAHAWTPWYSVFGSKSGFDSLNECFGDMAPYVYAIETGLSSDPRMNWGVGSLDSVALISNSDAHSLDKLGREANVFDLDEPSYDAFVSVLRERDRSRFLYTIEFFPEEGKYHFDGCATCGFSCDPARTRALGGRCPGCKRPLTVGVESRVEDLSDRPPDSVAPEKVPYKSIVPLREIIADAMAVGPPSKKVSHEYDRLIDRVGSEFHILLDAEIDSIARESTNSAVAEGVRRVRDGNLRISPGYDGVFGTVRIFDDDNRSPGPSQPKLI